MTNRDDLRRMLDELADETPEVPAHEWLAGTRHKVRVRRRARWAGAAAGTAVVLAAAVAVVPQVMEDASPPPAPVEPKPKEPREWEFVKGTKMNQIIASRLNDPGSSELEWRTSVEGSPRRFAEAIQFCQIPQAADRDRSPVRLVSYVDDHRLHVTPCRHWPKYPPVVGRMTVDRGAELRLAGYGIDRTKPFNISMWLERDGDPVEVPGVEFGVAFYWSGSRGPRGATAGESVDIPWTWPAGPRR